MITSGENEVTITETLTYMKTVLPEHAFYGIGEKIKNLKIVFILLISLFTKLVDVAMARNHHRIQALIQFS